MAVATLTMEMSSMPAVKVFYEAKKAEGQDDAALFATVQVFIAEYEYPHSQALVDVQGDVSRLSCVQRVQQALNQIAKNVTVNACVEVLAQSAVQQAAEADAALAIGGARRAQEGIPIIVKVNIDVAGTLSAGSMPGPPSSSRLGPSSWSRQTCLRQRLGPTASLPYTA